MEVSDIVYLDICCFKRPFDDATQERVRREAEAVATILDHVSRGNVRLVRSPAHDFENERHPREDRRDRLSVRVLGPDEVPLPGERDEA